MEAPVQYLDSILLEQVFFYYHVLSFLQGSVFESPAAMLFVEPLVEPLTEVWPGLTLCPVCLTRVTRAALVVWIPKLPASWRLATVCAGRILSQASCCNKRSRFWPSVFTSSVSSEYFVFFCVPLFFFCFFFVPVKKMFVFRF